MENIESTENETCSSIKVAKVEETIAKKYEFTKDIIRHNGHTLHRIKALKDFLTVKKGDLGGWIEREYNLSQESDCWVFNEAKVYGNARISRDSYIYNNVEVFGRAKVYDNVEITNNVKVYEDAEIYKDVQIIQNSKIHGY